MSSDGTQIHAMQQENLVLRDQFAQLRHLLDQTKGANSELVSENVLLKTELQRFKEQVVSPACRPVSAPMHTPTQSGWCYLLGGTGSLPFSRLLVPQTRP